MLCFKEKIRLFAEFKPKFFLKELSAVDGVSFVHLTQMCPCFLWEALYILLPSVLKLHYVQKYVLLFLHLQVWQVYWTRGYEWHEFHNWMVSTRLSADVCTLAVFVSLHPCLQQTTIPALATCLGNDQPIEWLLSAAINPMLSKQSLSTVTRNKQKAMQTSSSHLM